MGLLITFEGIEGCGKSTQIGLLKPYIEAKGASVLAVREPGGTAIGEKVRAILLDSASAGIDPWAELFLYEACRAELVRNVIRPALERGGTVICDRFTDSTLAYQGYGRGLDIEAIGAVNGKAAAGLVPDITILMDCPPKVGLERAWSRIGAKAGPKEDRFEKEDIEFHSRVRNGFLELSQKDPKRFNVIDACADIPSIHKLICAKIDRLARI